jgi:hypothetical protein
MMMHDALPPSGIEVSGKSSPFERRGRRLRGIRPRLTAMAPCLAGLLLFAGCGPKSVNLAGTAPDAKKVLSSSLEAWKEGRKPDQLQSGTPAVVMVDGDWAAGKSLKQFDVPGDAVRTGGHWRVAAVLTLGESGRPDSKKNVAYAVTLDTPISIIRADDVVNE